MLIADVILLVVCAVLSVLVFAHHRSFHVNRAHLDHVRDDYGWVRRRS